MILTDYGLTFCDRVYNSNKFHSLKEYINIQKQSNWILYPHLYLHGEWLDLFLVIYVGDKKILKQDTVIRFSLGEYQNLSKKCREQIEKTLGSQVYLFKNTITFEINLWK